MATLTDVRFAHEDGALADTLARLDSLDVRVLPETSTDPEGNMSVLAFENVESETVAEALERDHTVADVRPMPEFGDRNLWGVEFADDTVLLAPRVTREGGFVVDARSATPGPGPRGWYERWLLPDREAIHDIWEYAREAGFEFEVVDVHKEGPIDIEYPVREALTDEQREALVAAYEQGYFTEPRDASLADVAASLDHSTSAVGGRIKRGLRSLVELTLVVDRPRQ